MIWLDDDGAAPRLAPRGIEEPSTAIAFGRIDARVDELLLPERKGLARAVPARRQEFAAGRALARAAMVELGLTSAPIPRRTNRSPIWPEGVVGSISHCRHFAVAAVSTDLRSIGIDVECLSRIEPRLYDMLFTKHEIAAVSEISFATALFSAKESIFKAIHPLTGIHLEFKEVEVSLDLPAQRFAGRYLGSDDQDLIERVTGSVVCDDGHVLTLARLKP